MTSALKKLTKRRPTLDDVNTAMAELRTDGSRGAIVLAGALIEDILRGVILANMRQLKQVEHDLLFTGAAPLSSFSSKIRIADAFEFIGPNTTSDLHRLRELRNASAHAQVPVTFETPEIKNAITEFNWLSKLPATTGIASRELFITAMRFLMIHLIVQMPGSDDIAIDDELRAKW